MSKCIICLCMIKIIMHVNIKNMFQKGMELLESYFAVRNKSVALTEQISCDRASCADPPAPMDPSPDSVPSVPSDAIASEKSSGSRFHFYCNFCDKYGARQTIINHIKETHKFVTVTVDHYSPLQKEPVAPPVVGSDSSLNNPTSMVSNGVFRVHYACIFCDKYYTTIANVKKHIKKVHIIDHVKDEHYTVCMKQPKSSRIKPAGNLKLKPMFVTPLKGTGNTEIASNPGEDGVVESPSIDGELLQPVGGVQSFAGGGVEIHGAVPINLPSECLAPPSTSDVCQIQVREVRPVHDELPPAGKHGRKQAGIKKTKNKKPKKTSKIGFFKELENIILDPTKNEKLQLWKKKASTDIVMPAKIVTQAEIVTRGESVSPAESGTPIENVPSPKGFMPPESFPSLESTDLLESHCPPESLPQSLSALLPDKMATPDSTPSFSNSEVSKQTMKRGRRSTVPSAKGKGRPKCGLTSCVPCSYGASCGDCPECLNKKMK